MGTTHTARSNFRCLLLAEKPSQGRALAEALLGAAPRRSEENAIIGAMEDGVILCCAWAAGHLLRMASPEALDPSWAQFRWEDLPLAPPDGRFRHVPVEGKASWLQRIGRFAAEADSIVNACDAGREGELIFSEIMGWCGIDPNSPRVRRLWITDTTARGLRRAWAEAAPSSRYARLRMAAHARAEADWIWGYSATRMATLALPPPSLPGGGRAVWPVGRVQTPVLKIIEDRCLEIASFRPEAFWRMECDFKDGSGLRFKAALVAPKDLRFGHTDTHFHRGLQTAEIRRLLLSETDRGWNVLDSREARTQSPPPLFDLVDLQRSASRLWNWSAAETLGFAQRLYERDHAISYPRTDSAALPTAMRTEIAARRDLLWKEWALREWPALQSLPFPDALGSEHFSDEKVTDHHAIVPTGLVPDMTGYELGRLRPEYKIWELITVRFLLAWLPPARISHLRRLLSRDVGLSSSWRAVMEADPVEEPGWLAYEDAMLNTTGIGPPLSQRLAERSLSSVGDVAFLCDLAIRLGHTSPPHYFNDDLLLQRMVALGLGTPSTRAETIEGLEAAGLIERGTRSGRYITTPLGAQLAAVLRTSPAAIFTDPKETELWERQLELIERRREPMDKVRFIGNLVDRLRSIKAALENKGGEALHAFCPDTGRPVIEDRHRWIFPVGSRFANVVCPRVIAQRPMSAADYVQILLEGKKGGGPFSGFMGRNGAFSCWLIYRPKDRRFRFLFKSRGAGRSGGRTNGPSKAGTASS